MKAPPLGAVVFDAVGTLIEPAPPVATVYHAAGRRHGSRRTPDEVARRFGPAFREAHRTTDPADPHRTDEPTELAFWRAVVAAVLDDLAEPAAAACFADLFGHFARPESWRVYSDAAPTLRAVRAAGLATAIASNFDARLHAVRAGHPDLAAVGRVFVSSEVGRRKPDPRFFAAVCDGLGCRPAEVLFVGDDPAADHAAATAFGMRSVLLRRGGPPEPGVVTALTEILPWLGR